MNEIFTRRSVRIYEDKPVEQEKIEKIMRAGMQAPSAMNQQPWDFIVVTGKENLLKLSQYKPNSAFLATVGFAVIVLCDEKRLVAPIYWQQDLGAVTQNIMLEATHLGLGSCWFGTGPNEERAESIRNLYNLDSDIMPFCVIGIGYPKNENANHFIDRYDESRIKYIK